MNNKQHCITTEDLKALIQFNTDGVLIVDVRNADEYTTQHIEGALNIPLTELERRVTELSKEITIVTVCGKGGGRSAQAAELLHQAGFLKALFLCDGTLGWYAENNEV